MSEPLETLPLRDICKEAERLSRELIDHLENNLIPRTRELHELVKPDSPFTGGGENVRDVTVRNQAAALLESQRFMVELYSKARQYFEAVDAGIVDMVGGGR